MNRINLVPGITASVLLLSVLTIPAFAHHADDSNRPTINIPSDGSHYLLDINGVAHIVGTPDYEPVSAKLEWVVVSVKTYGVPQFGFQLVSGELSMDDNTYSLDRGVMNVQVQRILLEAAGSELHDLDMFATLAGPLPLSTEDEPVVVVPGQDRKSATMRIGADNWILDFDATIVMTA
ncbi:MAG: hypothetical protein ACRD38_07275 [Nitrososphaerales archaeon]